MGRGTAQQFSTDISNEIQSGPGSCNIEQDNTLIRFSLDTNQNTQICRKVINDGFEAPSFNSRLNLEEPPIYCRQVESIADSGKVQSRNILCCRFECWRIRLFLCRHSVGYHGIRFFQDRPIPLRLAALVITLISSYTCSGWLNLGLDLSGFAHCCISIDCFHVQQTERAFGCR